MSTHKYETFTYTPIELAESMTNTVHDTVAHLYRKGYIKEKDYEHLCNVLAVYPLPNRKGFGKRMLTRLFGTDENDSAFIFPIVEVEANYTNAPNPRAKPTLNIVEGDFKKGKTDE